MTLTRSIARLAVAALLVLTILVVVFAMGASGAATDDIGSWRWTTARSA